MSRWIELFDNHPFQAVWNDMLVAADNVEVDDNTVVTSVEEVARFNKVISYLSELLDACDPELIPASTWGNFHSQSVACLQQVNSYQTSRNINHIINANTNLDNLLTYLRPYQVVVGKAAKSASTSFSAYTKTINSSLTSFQRHAKLILTEVGEYKDKVIKDAEESRLSNIQIEKLVKEYFDDIEGESLKSKVKVFEQQLEVSYRKIQEYKLELIDGYSDKRSIAAEINSALMLAEANSETTTSLLGDVKTKLTDFKGYYVDVFGSKNDEGVFEGGLKDEIVAREKHLEQFKSQQELKYSALNDKIESLLPGATSAGLASAYSEMKASFDAPIKNYSVLFYGSISALMLISFISITQELGLFFIKFVDVSNFSNLVSNVLYKLPIIVPILWLTLFASKRRSEALRLQQEYAHKEALAKSYQNFRMQIEELEQSDPELMKKLLSSAIDAVSKNASDTLDKNHGDKTPAQEGVGSLITSIEKLKKVLL